MAERLGAALCVLAAFAAGCGSSGTTKHVAPKGAHPTTSSRQGKSAAPPGCGEYCLGAGPEGGPNPNECPARGGLCQACPASGCFALVSRDAAVSGDVVTVQARCELSRACVGAFLIFPRDGDIGSDGNRLTPEQRVAQGDLDVPANQTATVRLALTARGKQLLAGASQGYEADPYVVLEDYYVKLGGGGPLGNGHILLRP